MACPTGRVRARLQRERKENNVNHIEVLKRALTITWKYRALWLIGLLLVVAGGGVTGGFSGASSAASGNDPRWESQGDNWSFGRNYHTFDDMWADIGPYVATVAVAVAVLFVAALIIGVVKVIARYVTRTSLLQMVNQYEESGEQVGFWSGLRRGWSRSAFRLFTISLGLKLPLTLLMVLSIGSLVTLGVLSITTETGPGIALGIALVLLVIPIILVGAVVGAILGPVIEVAYRTCALKGTGAWEAIRSAFGLVRRNLGATALQWLLLVGLNIAWNILLIPVNILLVVLGLFIGGVPAVALGGLGGLATGSPVGLGIGALAYIPVFILVLAVPNVLLTTAATIFHSTTWTLAYREIELVDGGRQGARLAAAAAD